MTATLPEARSIVQRLAGQRVRVPIGDTFFEGRLRPKIYAYGKTDHYRFVIFGRSSDWRKQADQFASDPAVYKMALRSYARPECNYIRFDLADLIEVVAR